ncbi:MAG: hypothetical protein ABEL76_15165 [Bradymonadaceae bacterium]
MTDRLILVVLCCALLASGCDDVAFTRVGSAPPADNDVTGTVRAILPTPSLAPLFRTVRSDGLRLDSKLRRREIDGTRVAVGPLDRTVAIDDWRSRAADTSLEVGAAVDDPSIVVPVRISSSHPPRICRLRVAAAEWLFASDLTTDGEDAWRLAEANTAELTARQSTVELIGDCPPLAGSDGKPTEATAQTVQAYAHRALRRAFQRAIAIRPLDAAGVLRETVRLEHSSPLENRRGTIDLRARPPSGGLSLETRGIRGRWAFDVSTDRAACAPPVPGRQPEPSPVAPIPADTVTNTGADLAVGLSQSLLGRLAQSFALSGLACRGRASGRNRTAYLDRISVPDARLNTIGLGQLPVDGQLFPVSYPGGLPRIELEARSNRLTATWPDLTLELYGRIDGAPVEIAEVRATATIVLRPTADDLDQLQFDVQSLQVEHASFSSPWADSGPGDDELTRWARRLFLVVFDDHVAFPLPLEPGSPSRLEAVRVRRGDLLLLLELVPS